MTTIQDRIEVLLSWCTSPFRSSSDDRIFLTGHILACVKTDRNIPPEEFQKYVTGWLEQLDVSEDGEDILVRLFSELSKRKVFSHGEYVNKMLARGILEHNCMTGKVSYLFAFSQLQ